jgi:hypothetical protein
MEIYISPAHPGYPQRNWPKNNDIQWPTFLSYNYFYLPAITGT